MCAAIGTSVNATANSFVKIYLGYKSVILHHVLVAINERNAHAI